MEGIEMLFVKVTRTFQVSGHESVAELDEHTDLVMEELLKLESDVISDSDVSAELANGVVSVSIAASADDYDAACAIADSCIRAAIHAAGGSTPEWVTIAMRSRQLAAA